MNFILRQRFSYLDMFFNAIGVVLLTQGMIIVAMVFLVLMVFVSVALEAKFKPESTERIWQRHVEAGHLVQAMQAYRLIHNSSLLEAHTAIHKYLKYKQEV